MVLISVVSSMKFLEQIIEAGTNGQIYWYNVLKGIGSNWRNTTVRRHLTFQVHSQEEFKASCYPTT